MNHIAVVPKQLRRSPLPTRSAHNSSHIPKGIRRGIPTEVMYATLGQANVGMDFMSDAIISKYVNIQHSSLTSRNAQISP